MGPGKAELSAWWTALKGESVSTVCAKVTAEDEEAEGQLFLLLRRSYW